MRESMKTVLAVLSVVVLAGAFWMFLLSPKREKANELSQQADGISAEVSAAKSQLAVAEQAKKNFAPLYGKLVLIGKAVPSEAGTASLVVQLQGIANRTHTAFSTIQLASSGTSETTAPAESESAATASAAQLPLGAATGPAGLPAMPYTLEFQGTFFEIARFTGELDALVKTNNEGVDADGRLVMVDGFTLEPGGKKAGPQAGAALIATFQVTTYVAPPGQGLTAGATAAGPETLGTTEGTTEVGTTP